MGLVKIRGKGEHASSTECTQHVGKDTALHLTPRTKAAPERVACQQLDKVSYTGTDWVSMGTDYVFITLRSIQDVLHSLTLYLHEDKTSKWSGDTRTSLAKASPRVNWIRETIWGFLCSRFKGLFYWFFSQRGFPPLFSTNSIFVIPFFINIEENFLHPSYWAFLFPFIHSSLVDELELIVLNLEYGIICVLCLNPRGPALPGGHVPTSL